MFSPKQVVCATVGMVAVTNFVAISLGLIPDLMSEAGQRFLPALDSSCCALFDTNMGCSDHGSCQLCTFL
jgi:hypothetical protein